MMSHGWPIVVRGGMLSPRGYGSALCIDDLLPPDLALRVAALHLTALIATSRCSVRDRLRGRRGAAAGRAAGRTARLADSGAAPAGRPLLRSDHPLARRRAVGLACARDRRRLGAAEGTDADDPPVIDSIAVPAAVLTAPSGCAAGSRGAAGVARQPGLHPDAGRQDGGRSRSKAANDGLRCRVPGAGLAIVGGRCADHTRRLALRRYSLDEFPNLVNVLRGDMSLSVRATFQARSLLHARQRGRLASNPESPDGRRSTGGRAPVVGADRTRPLLRRTSHLRLD